MHTCACLWRRLLYSGVVFGHVRLRLCKPVDRVIRCGMLAPPVPELSHEEKVAKVHAFKIRCVHGVHTLLAAHQDAPELRGSCHLPRARCLKNCFWLLMLLYPGVCKKARALSVGRTPPSCLLTNSVASRR